MDNPFKIITVGDKDASKVKQIQTRLNQLGFGPIVEDGIFGSNTLLALKAYQSLHRDLRGHPLVIDGVVGDLTWSSLFDNVSAHTISSSPLINDLSAHAISSSPLINDLSAHTISSSPLINDLSAHTISSSPLINDLSAHSISSSPLINDLSAHTISSSPLINEVLKIALYEKGVREDPMGSNSGPRVDEYLRSVNLGPGYSWCAAFVYWCFKKASAKLNLANPLVKTGACLQHWQKTRGLKIALADAMKNPSLIEPGAIFIVNRGRGKGHTGIVISVHGDLIRTIEGNAYTDLAPKEMGVFELDRAIASINPGFIIYH